MTVAEEVIEGFKMTEIGLLPEDWDTVKVGTVFEFSKKPRSLEIKNTEIIPFIPMEFISDDNKAIRGWQTKRFSEISSGTFVFKNDLIIAKITPSFENGKQAILNNLPKDFGYATTEVWVMHPKDDKVHSDFFFNLIRIPSIRNGLAQ
ncbi:MAG: restriction endonuclease subunit S [Nitrospirae bacterium]|nr:restriction endonuclease subunit S [Nitrospirota bacterium]